jgi:hypothetical protein
MTLGMMIPAFALLPDSLESEGNASETVIVPVEFKDILSLDGKFELDDPNGIVKDLKVEYPTEWGGTNPDNGKFIYYTDGKNAKTIVLTFKVTLTDDVAKMLSKLKWIRQIRMSADTDAMLNVVLTAIDRLGKYGMKPYRVFVYVLVQDVESAERRVIALREVGADPFAQPYRDFTTNTDPPLEQRRFARWVNDKAIFKTVQTFAEYRARKR